MGTGVSNFPDLIFQIDESAAELEQYDWLAGADAASSDLAYPRTLAFDWSALRLKLDHRGGPMVVEGQRALVEWVVKALLTPRYEVPVYSDDYGAEFHEVEGETMQLARAQIPRIVTETLEENELIQEIVGLEVNEGPVRGSLRVQFAIRDYTGEVIDIPDLVVGLT